MIIVLFCYEVNDYMRTKIKKDTYIALDPHEGDFISMNIDITFPHAPCFSKAPKDIRLAVINIEQKSTVQVGAQSGILQKLVHRRLDRNDQPLDQIEPNFDDATSVVDLVRKTLENDEKCNLRGKVQLRRVNSLL